MWGDISGRASPLLLFALFFCSSTRHEYIIRRHWLTATGWCWEAVASPLPSSFILFIPPSHTLFMLLLNLADCQFPGLLFHQVAFFHYQPDGSPTLFLLPHHSFFHFSLTLLYLPLFLLTASLCVSLLPLPFCFPLPLSPLCAQEV